MSEIHKPDRVAIEDTFMNTNAASALKLGAARGGPVFGHRPATYLGYGQTQCMGDLARCAPFSILRTCLMPEIFALLGPGFSLFTVANIPVQATRWGKFDLRLLVFYAAESISTPLTCPCRVGVGVLSFTLVPAISSHCELNLDCEIKMNLKARRLKEGWSQQHLAEISGLSERTIQRIENGEKASLESTKALSAAFNISSAELQISTALSQENYHMQPSPINNGFLSSISKPWKQVAIHFGAFMFFMTWLALLQSMLGFDSEVLGPIGITWGSLLALHAIIALGGEDEDGKHENKHNNK